ncbi:MAG: (4Fe-4S)-binding protein [Chloroflexi bacterium]|nr:(4Fe-4S)-binding protein [Chloroflexota bacterium]
MQIDQMLCTACEECIPWCPVGAIKPANGTVEIDLDECVECGTCLRYASCPVQGIEESPETSEWPRVLRREFSDPGIQHSTTKGFGRGTEESKTNDVTGRVKRGRVGMGLEFGRPGIATRLGELEKMTTALAKIGVHWEEKNPVSFLLADRATGKMRDDVKNERVLSAILEFEFDAARLPEIVPVVETTAETLDTVFSWCLFTRLEDDGSIPVMPALERLGLPVRPNAKINMGLGRPLVE